MHPLDNPIHAALTGPHAALGRHRGAASVYDPAFTVFAGLADPADPAGWADLAGLLGPDGRAALFLAAPPVVPAGFTALRQRFIVQMIGPEAPIDPGPAPDGLCQLTDADSAEMMALAQRTEPGPMGPRTVAMGRYLGVRDAAGALVAMAGERLALRDHVEISGVCTDPAWRGRGLARLLVARLTADAAARGQRSFLHVKTENEAARHVYAQLGYTVRCDMHLSVVQAA